jgi:glycosyltransferase involved in cell wall biosynthesis
VLVPGDIDSRTGGYGYDRRIVQGLRARGWPAVIRGLDASFPFPTRLARDEAARILAEIPDDTPVLIDGLAFGALADEARRERARLRLVALVHHPLSLETGLSLERSTVLQQSERDALTSARLVIVTSRATIRSLAPYDVPKARIVVIEPGTDEKPIARGSSDGVIHLLAVGSVVPRKGYHTLVDALAEVSDLSWRLTCVGSLRSHPETARSLQAKLVAAGLAGRVTLAGELGESEIAGLFEAADVFVLPTFYEGYGMAVAEALSYGLPVISTPTGAIPELVGDAAGILVPPGDARALAGALRRLMTDPVVRANVTEAARRVRGHLPTWERAALAMEAALRSVLDRDPL